MDLTLINAFTLSEVSAAINIVPNRYGRLQELNLMPVRGVMQRDIAVEEKNGSLALIPTEQYGGPGIVGKVGKRKVRTFRIPKLVYDEYVSPQEVQGVRAFGGNGQQAMAALLNDKLETARAKHDITLEYLRMGALKGTILDADGSTLYNLYTEFGISQKTVDFVLGTSTTKVSDKCREVVRHIEDNLLGEMMTSIRCLVSAEFYDKLITHAKVEAAYANYAEAAQRLGGDLRTGFTFAGITFEEYRGQSTDTAGNTARFIAANDGHAFPLGTVQSFGTFAGPADFNETVGSLGQVYYAKVQPAEFDRGYKVHTQSNVLPLCMRPAVCVRVYSSN
jgi:hypothetical protein